MRRVALPLAVLAAAGALLVPGCGGGGKTAASDGGSSQPSRADSGTTTSAGGLPSAGRVDPRRGGFEVALGEWQVALEARQARPGPVTFVVVNRGTMPHGLEIEREEDDSDAGKIETRVLDPGETIRVELDLGPGVYKLECNVEGHDDLGMETLLEVRKRARLAQVGGGQRAAQATARPAVEISGFAFEPRRVEAVAGQNVRWTNHDSAEHTVTQAGGGFDSGSLAAGASFSARFDRPGAYRYVCALHPAMRGVVVVTDG